MKVTIENASCCEEIRFCDMQIGVLYEITTPYCDQKDKGKVVVRLYGDTVTVVGEFDSTWRDAERIINIKVRPLPQGTQVVLTQE